MLSVYSRGCRERCYLFTAGGVGSRCYLFTAGGVGEVLSVYSRGCRRGVICLQPGV